MYLLDCSWRCSHLDWIDHCQCLGHLRVREREPASETCHSTDSSHTDTHSNADSASQTSRAGADYNSGTHIHTDTDPQAYT